MNTIKILGIGFFLIIFQISFAQEVKMPGTEISIDISSFEEDFVKLVDEQREYDYYAVDLSKLPSDFEKVYFVSLSGKKQELIPVNSDLDGEVLWFKSYYANKPDDIICMIDDLKTEVKMANREFSQEKKDELISFNAKYLK